MNKGDLIRNIAGATGATQKEATAFLDAFIGEVKKAVSNNDDVTLIGFGKFHSVKRSARTGRNPATGEPMDIPEKTVPKFTPGKKFKDKVG